MLKEDVTPAIFARRVLLGLSSYGALRDGEGVMLPNSGKVEVFDSLNEEVRSRCHI